MNGTLKTVLLILGLLAAVLVIGQLAMGLSIANGNATLVKSHRHSGYLTVVVALAYIGWSLWAIGRLPGRGQASSTSSTDL